MESYQVWQSANNLARICTVNNYRLSLIQRVVTFLRWQSGTMATALQAHLDSILQTATSIASLSFSDIPTHFIASLHQPGVDNLIRDPHPHERGLFTVRQPSERKENPLTLDGESPARILRTRQEKNEIRPLLLPKYSGGGNVEADVFLKSASTLLNI